MNKLHLLISCILTITLLFSCASNDPLSVEQNSADENSIQMKRDKTFSTTTYDSYWGYSYSMPSVYSTTGTVYYQRSQKVYHGLMLYMPANNSTFYFNKGSVSPPETIQKGKDFNLTFSLEKDTVNNELIYTFNPHGCTFDPPAELVLDYAELNTDSPQLFYIEDDGTYTEQTPDHVDTQNKWITIYIDHFSRYAMSYGR